MTLSGTPRRRPRFRWTSSWGEHEEPGYNRYAYGYDVKCECGWESRTGGAIRAYVLRTIDDHLLHGHGIVAVDGKVYGYIDD